MILKIIDSIKIELVLLQRNIWTWIALVLIAIHAAFLIYESITAHAPQSMLIDSAYFVQMGIFIALVLGFTLLRRESEVEAEDLFSSLSGGYSSKILSKVLAFSILVICISVTKYLLVTLLILWLGIHPAMLWTAFLYMLLYWVLPFLFAGGLGMLFGILIRSRFIYVLFVLLAFLFGPINDGLMQILINLSWEGFSYQNMYPVLNFLNVGQTDIGLMFDPVYGFPLEIHRWLQKGIFLTSVVAILATLIIWKNYGRWPRWGYSLSGLFLLFIVLQIVLLNQEEQVIRTKGEQDSVGFYDAHYYEENKQAQLLEGKPFRITGYDIDLEAFRRLEVDVELEILAEERMQDFVFTLYRDLRVQEIGNSLGIDSSWQQVGDQIKISLAEEIEENQAFSMQISYRGTSSPYFFANEQALMLPAYFAWLPVAGSYQTMISEYFEVKRIALYPEEETLYRLKYSGPKPLYTNLIQVGEGEWQGRAPNGLTLVGALLQEELIAQSQIIYPISMYRLPIYVPDYLEILAELDEQVNVDLKLDGQINLEQIYFLSVPMEGRAFHEGMWALDDHTIIAVEQRYHSSNFLSMPEVSISYIISAKVRNRAWTLQLKDMQETFLSAYVEWYSYQENVEKQLDPFSTLTQNAQYSSDQDFSRTVRELSRFMRGNVADYELMASFFHEWLAYMHQEEVFTWGSLAQLIERSEQDGK